MFPFLPPKTLKHVGEKLRGKMRRYRFVRNNGHLAFTGSLLSFFRHQDAPEPLLPGCASVDTLAVFRTRAGRYLVYYIVAYPEHDELIHRHEYVQVCSDLPGLRDFFAAMAYPNKERFVARVLRESGLPTESPEADTAPPDTAAPDKAPAPAVPADGSAEAPPSAS